ncbi:hypothetical protein Kfla_0978 [Kribbella flavida DSM 17836]|uniref:Uncharacterized protein n=1 Tax=Kribbella flavida (strain DSM 17836 / JCM 10339 / NBRC 14399) TaxID=479435 RepID=D2Q195_KRIFD|nr:hypothetical protein [Kribbella flavida]ADB30083.1 hypothetical protein Kfla_0978 [Kribbella flavida DSM 17836]
MQGETGNGEREDPPALQDLQVRGRPVRTWVAGAGVVLLAISAAFGGLAKAEEETPRVDAGTAVDAGQFEVTIQRVTVVTDLKPLFSPDEGGALLGVVTKLELTDKTGTTAPTDLIRVLDVPGIKPTDAPLGTTNLRDQTQSPVLTPGFGEDVAYIWKLPKATELPRQVTLGIQHYTFGESVLDHHEKWTKDRLAAETTVAVKDNTK